MNLFHPFPDLPDHSPATMQHVHALGHIDDTLAKKLDQAWGAPDDWAACGWHWTQLDEVRAAINRKVTGDAALSPLAWFFRVVGMAQALPLTRVLVLGCGAGRVEREVMQQGWAREVVAIDLSAKVLEVARAEATGLHGIGYFQADMNCLPIGDGPFQPAAFDAVLGVSSVHHCAELECLYQRLGVLLRPGGFLFLDEYVGPDRFQWPDAQLRHLNRLAGLLPTHMMSTLQGEYRSCFRAPSVAEVIAVDPSEAVRSSDLLSLLGAYFVDVMVRPYGGAILHLLLAHTAQNFVGEKAAPYLHSVMAAEDELYRSGQLQHHFACAIARRPG